MKEALAKYVNHKRWGWYQLQPDKWKRYLATTQKVRVLEIGANNGVSANLMLDEIFTHPESEVHTIDPYLSDPTTPKVGKHTRLMFQENCRRGGHGERIHLYEVLSVEVMGWMITKEGFREGFDMVFIDGSHFARDVMTDASMGWPLLKPGGMIVFDDFEWGSKLPHHMRPREAVLAFEAAFVEFLVPVWRGYQRIYRKTGVPGGLKDRAGNPAQLNVVIAGTYDSGSSLLSSIVECLGFNIGRPGWQEFFESASLRLLLRRGFDPATMTRKIERMQLVEELKEWLAGIKPSSPALCVKHPLLGLCLPEFEAWGAETIFLRASRPLEASIRGLKRRGWFPEPEKMQRKLYNAIEEFFGEGKPCLNVEFDELLAHPDSVIRSLASGLGIEAEDSTVEKAVRLIRPSSRDDAMD